MQDGTFDRKRGGRQVTQAHGAMEESERRQLGADADDANRVELQPAA